MSHVQVQTARGRCYYVGRIIKKQSSSYPAWSIWFRRLNIDLLIHQHQGTVNFSRQTCSEESEEVRLVGNGRRSLGFPRCDLNPLYYAVKIKVPFVPFMWSALPSLQCIELPPLPWSNRSNKATGCFPIHRIFQIWFRIISLCFRT